MFNFIKVDDSWLLCHKHNWFWHFITLRAIISSFFSSWKQKSKLGFWALTSGESVMWLFRSVNFRLSDEEKVFWSWISCLLWPCSLLPWPECFILCWPWFLFKSFNHQVFRVKDANFKTLTASVLGNIVIYSRCVLAHADTSYIEAHGGF